MDRTSDFAKAAAQVISDSTDACAQRQIFASSPFVMRCDYVYRQIIKNSIYMKSVNDAYIDYHQQLCESNMTDLERQHVAKNVALFITSSVSDIQELSRVARYEAGSDFTRQAHYDGIVAHLTKCLEAFTKNYKKMQRERERVIALKNPFGWHVAKDILPFDSEPALQSIGTRPSAERGATNTTRSTQLPTNFLDRYESEVAKPETLRKYAHIIAEQKASLLKEAKHLNEVFNEELLSVNSIEATVGDISSMLSDFMGILSEQSDQLGGISQSGKMTTEAVQQTSKELQLTIERTESHSRNIVLLACGLAILLLLLDWITP